MNGSSILFTQLKRFEQSFGAFSFILVKISKQRVIFTKEKGELVMIKFKEKTREELIAGFKRAIERKREFEE